MNSIINQFPIIPRTISLTDVTIQPYQIIGVNPRQMYGTISNDLYSVVWTANKAFTIYSNIDNIQKCKAVQTLIVEMWDKLFSDRMVDNFIGNYEQARRLLTSNINSSVYQPMFSSHTEESVIGYLEGLYRGVETAIYTWFQTQIPLESILIQIPEPLENILTKLTEDDTII